MDLFFTENQQIIFLKKHGWEIAQVTFNQHLQIHGSQFHEYSEIYEVATKSETSLKIEDAFRKQLETCLLDL